MLTLSACAAQQTQPKGVNTCSDDPEGTRTQKRAPADSAPVQRPRYAPSRIHWLGTGLCCRAEAHGP